MSIASQLTALTGDKTAIANKITEKGGTLSQNAGFDTFATDIGTIPTGASEEAILSKYFRGDIDTLPSDYFSGVTSLYSSFFAANQYLKKVQFSSDLLSIGGSIFSSSYVEEIDLSLCTSVTSIPNTFASYARGLKKVILPFSITNIGVNSFGASGSASASDYTMNFIFLGNTPPSLSNASSSLPPAQQGLVMEVPYSSDHSVKQAYITAYPAYEPYIVESQPT